MNQFPSLSGVYFWFDNHRLNVLLCDYFQDVTDFSEPEDLEGFV